MRCEKCGEKLLKVYNSDMNLHGDYYCEYCENCLLLAADFTEEYIDSKDIVVK